MSVPDCDDGGLILQRPFLKFLPLSAAWDVEDVAKKWEREWPRCHSLPEPQDTDVVYEYVKHTEGQGNHGENDW